MRSGKEFFCDDSEKNEEKIAKALAKSGCEQYQASFLQEARSSSTIEFEKAKCLVTDSYLCCYADHSGLSMKIEVIPIADIAGLYRTNLLEDDKYDYDGFSLAVDMKDGSKKRMGRILRDYSKNAITRYDEVISCVRQRIN